MSSNGEPIPAGVAGGYRQLGPLAEHLDGGLFISGQVVMSEDGNSFRLEHPPLPEGYFQAEFTGLDGGIPTAMLPVAAQGMYLSSMIDPYPPWIPDLLHPLGWSPQVGGCVPWEVGGRSKLECIAADVLPDQIRAVEISIETGRDAVYWKRKLGPIFSHRFMWLEAFVDTVEGDPCYFAVPVGWPSYELPAVWQYPVLWRRLDSPAMELKELGRGSGPVCGIALAHHGGQTYVVVSEVIASPGELLAFRWDGPAEAWTPTPIAPSDRTYCGMRGADFDGDGESEIVATQDSMAGVVLLQLDGAETLTLVELVSTIRGPAREQISTDSWAERQVRPFVGDLDGDKRPDILVHQDGALEAWFNDSTPGQPAFAVRNWSGLAGPPSVAGYFSSAEGGIVTTVSPAGVIAGRDGPFVRQAYRWQYVYPDSVFPMELADLDGDGHLDLAYQNQSTIHLWRVPNENSKQERAYFVEEDGGILRVDWYDPVTGMR